LYEREPQAALNGNGKAGKPTASMPMPAEEYLRHTT